MANPNSWLFLLLIPLLAFTFYLPESSHIFSDFLSPVTITKLLSVVIHLPASHNNSITGNMDAENIRPHIPDNRPTIEIGEAYTRISGPGNRTIRVERLKEKPAASKNPGFSALAYIEIHEDIPANSGAVIRIFNEWERSDLIIYHYKDNDWHPLHTSVNGSYLEAEIGSFSVFAVGATGGINLRLLADTLVLASDTVTISGSAYYNNSSAASGISIEINPSWTGLSSITADAEGNFIRTIAGPALPGSYTVWVNATSGSLNGTDYTTVEVTNATIYRVNASANISGTATSPAGISFQFPSGAVPEASVMTIIPGSPVSMHVKMNNITIFNATTSAINLNLTGYLDTGNEINITTGSPVNLDYTISSGFHTTKIAQVVKQDHYSASLNVTNNMSYQWNGSGILFHIPDGAYNVSVWENSSNITANSSVAGSHLRILNSGIGTINGGSTRNFFVNYSLRQIQLGLTSNMEESEKGETVIITPSAYYNGSLFNATVRIIIYRDAVPVYDGNITSGSQFGYSNTTAGVYNITASATAVIDGVERTGSNRTDLHIKDLLMYLTADPVLSHRSINLSGRAYFTNNTGYAGMINLSLGSGSWSTISDTSGYFSFLLPGQSAGTYNILANTSVRNSTAAANVSVDVTDNFFYVVKGDLPVVSGDATLSPDVTLWINNTNITRARLYMYGKTTANVTYDPFPYPVNFKLIPAAYGSSVSGNFTIPLYPYDYIVIKSAYLNTSAEIKDPANTGDMAFNLTIDGRQVNSYIILAGESPYSRSDSLTGYVPSILNPGTAQTIRVYNKNIASTQQYYFSEEIYVSYTGFVGSPEYLSVKVNNNLTFAASGNFTNAAVDITGLRSATSALRLDNRRTSVAGYNLTLQKRYSGCITHNVTEETSIYRVNDTAVFTPSSTLTSATVRIPLIEHAVNVAVYVNGTDMTAGASIGEDMELFLNEINATKVINITYRAPILDIVPSVNNTQFNPGDAVQVRANVTYLGADVSDAVVYANITRAGAPAGNVTLNFSGGGTYTGNYTLSSGASIGLHNVTVWAYNATTAKDSEIATFRVRELNVTVNREGPYVVDTNATITGYVRDLENGSGTGASVNITFWNSTFSDIANTTANSTGYFALSRIVDWAGEYNVTVNASSASIRGSGNANYTVKYSVSAGISQPSYNKNSAVPVNVTVYDLALTPVSGASVNSAVVRGGSYTYYSGTTDANGQYSFTHADTGTYGIYNVTINVTKAGVTGNATGSFRISNLTVTVNNLAQYQVGSAVVINGTVRDDENSSYPNGAVVNVTLNNGSTGIMQGTTTSAGNYSISFSGLYAGVYSVSVDVTYISLSGSAASSFHMHYSVSADPGKSIFATGEAVPINITVLDVGGTPATAYVSINITKPDAGVENLNGTTAGGYLNLTFTNATLEGDYTITAQVQNSTTQAHGDASARTFRVSGFVVNATPDRIPALYKPGETVNISGLLRDTLGAGRTADVVIRINSSAGNDIANTTLTGMNGSYSWNHTLASDSAAGWYAVNVSALSPEGAVNSTSTGFEVQLNIAVNANSVYNPGGAVNATIPVRNGSTPESAVVNMAVQRFDIWDDFTGTYFDTTKMNATSPDYDSGYYLNVTQSDELLFYTTNLTPNNTWAGKAVQINASLSSHFILDYEASAGGTSSQLVARPSIGNATSIVRFNLLNYSNDAQDGYNVSINGVERYAKTENMNNRKVRFSIEYDAGKMRFYKNGEQFFQSDFTLPSNSVIKLNGYALNAANGSSADIRFDNVTLYNVSSQVLNESIADGSGGSYTFNFTAGAIGMYRINATSGNSSSYAVFRVRTLNITSLLYGPYNFNESTLSPGTVVPLFVQGTVQDTQTRANISGAEVNITIIKDGAPYISNLTTTNAGVFIHNFTGDFNSTTTGVFNVSLYVNDSGILAVHNTSFTVYTIEQSWSDHYKDFRVPLLLYNNNQTQRTGTVTFNLALPGGADSASLFDISGNDTGATIIDMGSYLNVTLTATLRPYEGKMLYMYFERSLISTPHTASLSSIGSSYEMTNGTVEGYILTIAPDKNVYSAGETVILTSRLLNVTGVAIVSGITTSIYYPNGTSAQVNYTTTGASGEAQVNYTIPSLKGSFTAVTNATVNGVPRRENATFSVGDLDVNISTDRRVYNTLTNATISVDVTENGNATAADLMFRIYNPNSAIVFEETRSTKTLWVDTSDADFGAGTAWDVNITGGSVILATGGGNYTLSGNLTSGVYDAGRTIDWGTLSWNASEPLSTNITLYTRTSQDNSTWSPWVMGSNGADIPGSSRYIQYSANLTTTDNTSTPALLDVTIELAQQVSLVYTLPSSPLGNYTITAGASRSGNAGYNATVFELDRFEINATADKAVITSPENVTVRGYTLYRGSGATANVTLTVKNNLALNPSFETDLNNNSQPDGWSPAWNGVFALDNTVSRTGNGSVKVTLFTSNITEGLWYYPDMYVISPGTYYTFSMRAKTDNNTGGNVRLWVDWYNGTSFISTGMNVQKNVRAVDIWVLAEGRALSPANASNARVHLVSGIVGNAWFDDVDIEPDNNPAVYTANTASNLTYNFTFPSASPGSYIVYSNGSFSANGTLNRSSTTMFTVRSLDVNVSGGWVFEPGAGNFTFSGYAVDNITRMAAPNATVYINVTYPNSTIINYTAATSMQGYYNYTVDTPSRGGTYGVNVTAKDYQGVYGRTNTTFRVRLTPGVQTNKTQYNLNETVLITVNVTDSASGISGATVNITVRNPSGTGRNFSTLYGNVTDGGSGAYYANYSDASMTGNYTINATVAKGTDNGAANGTFMARRLNVIVQTFQAVVGETRSLFARVEDETTLAAVASASVNISTANATSIVNQTNATSINRSGYNIEASAYTDRADRYNITVNVTDQYGIRGSAVVPYTVNLSVAVLLFQTTYNPYENISATVIVRDSITSPASGAAVVINLTYYNGSVIQGSSSTTDANGNATANFTAPGGYSSFYINATASKNGINGQGSRLFTNSNLRIWTDKGEVLTGDPVWNESKAPEEFRNITVKLAVLDSAGLRRSGQVLTANVYYPNETLYGTYPLAENDKIYSTSILFPGKNIPEGTYPIRIAEYPGISGNLSVMIWGCARCHTDNSKYIAGNFYNIGHYGLTINHDNEDTMAPSNFSINHSHRSLAKSCWMNHETSYGSLCGNCHTFEGSAAPPTACKACHNSANHSDEGYLNDTYGADIHANINQKPGGAWYGKATACQSCHGNITGPPSVPQCTGCHPGSSGSGMRNVPGSLSGSNTTLEDFEDVSDVTGTSGYKFSTVSISTNVAGMSGNSGQVDYTLGAGYGRVYIDRKNLDLTNATGISLWVNGDNSNITMYLLINNTRSSKINWHQSQPVQINWNGWRRISVPITELSQSSLLYITFADTVRIKLEATNDSGYSGTILIDDLRKEKAGSHTQYADIECGLCHGGRHNLQRPPDCSGCHQTEGHGWPQQDKYPQQNATCMGCHQSGVSENRVNISRLEDHADVLEDFENTSVFSVNLTNFIRSDAYYSGAYNDSGNHSALLNYAGLTGYLGNSINATNASSYKGITVAVNASVDPGTKLVLGVYTTSWYNYTIPLDWNGWRLVKVLFRNSTVNESASFNSTGTPALLYLGVLGNGSTGSVYFDDLRLAVDDHYHQYEAWTCSDCHTQVGNLPGITDITAPITDCSTCHNQSEPHIKDFRMICMDCHFDAGHGEVDPGFTDYEKASTCLKCHAMPHNFSSTHLTTGSCNNCHQQRIHGQNSQSVAYNASIHLDCERCHGKAITAGLPLAKGSPGSIFTRFSYTYNNESECSFCHQSRINSFRLHTNISVDESNLTLVQDIRNDTLCNDCHGTKSVANASDRDELTASDALKEPRAAQVAGHGNVSCYKCHGHRPETLILNVGSNCVGCHQNLAELVYLIPGKLNASEHANVTNPGAWQLIVHPPQVTGHGNTSCSNCHGHANSNLTYTGLAASSCIVCHQNASSIISLIEYRQPNSTRSNITNPGGNPLLVNPPQVLGHGNASCRECHDHAPSTFKGYDLVGGENCESCHQNTSTNVSLIENTTPASNLTVVLDNSTISWLVLSPQVAGHGHTACSECHSHSSQNLVFNGRTDAECVICHYNASAAVHRLQNGSFVQPTQVLTHNDMNCTACHGHTPASMIREKDCKVCHQNITKAQSLVDTYGTGLNVTPPSGNISAVQVPPLNHSTGSRWNRTAAYWNNATEACQYCHRISVNYSRHDTLGRVSAIAGNNTKNSTLTGSYWCSACHYQFYSSGNVTYNDTVSIFLAANLSVPPEITANTSFGNYTTSNDGVGYFIHILSGYSDSECVSCHGSDNRTKDFMHDITPGGGSADCISCHNTGGTAGSGRLVNFAAANGTDAIHRDLNDGVVTALSPGNRKCWACHGTGSEPAGSHPANYKTPYLCTNCHAGGMSNFTPYAILTVSQHNINGTTIRTPAASTCYDCHNISGMMINGADPDGAGGVYAGSNGGNLSVSHYGIKRSDLMILNSTAYCGYCHRNSSTAFPFADVTLKNVSHGDDCASCHGTGRIHNGSLLLPTMNGGSGACLECHGNMSNRSISAAGFINSAHKNLECIDCHTPRLIKSGMAVGGQMQIFVFTIPANVTWLNASIEGNGSIISALIAPDAAEFAVPVNISMPISGNWSATVRNTAADAVFTLAINASISHPGSTPKICQTCHAGGYRNAPLVFRHIPDKNSSVPANVSCVSCHANGAKPARTQEIAVSHYLPLWRLDTRDCISCHMDLVNGYGTPPDPRNHTRYAPLNVTLISGEPLKLVDNYSLTLEETTREAAIFRFEKDGVLLRRELVAFGDVFKYEVSGLGRDKTTIVDLTIKTLFTSNGRYLAELSGNVLASRIHTEKENTACYACHDREFRSNMPDGMDYYVLKKEPENVTIERMPVNFTDRDTKMLNISEDWEPGDGYKLHVADVNMKRGNAYLRLYRNGTLLEDVIINEGSYFTHEEQVLDRKINVFGAKLQHVFIGSQPAIILGDVRIISEGPKVLNSSTRILQDGTQPKYFWLDGGINVGKIPSGFHVYTLAPGNYSPDCISCHTGNGVAPVKIDLAKFRKGVHIDLNRNATYTGFITDEANKACWACHGNGSEPSGHPLPYLAENTPRPCVSCHTYSQFGAKQIFSHYPGAGISTKAACHECHSNTLENVTGNVKASASHYSSRKELINTSRCEVCHDNETNASVWGRAPQVRKHNPGNNCTLCHAGNIATFHDKGITITRTCEDCHINEERAKKFSLDIIRTHYPGAPEGKADTLAQSEFTCRMCHNATKSALHSSLTVREYQNSSMGYCFQCHSAQGKFPHRPQVLIKELRHGLGIKVISGCEGCHSLEGVSKFHSPSLIGKGYFSETGNYKAECTGCHEKHEERKYQPYENITCIDCHSEYGAAHYANAQITLVNKSKTCLRCHNEDADKFHNLTRLAGNVTDAAYEPCRECHKDIEPVKAAQNSSSKILRGTMFNDSITAHNISFRTCTSCHNATGESRFHYSSYPMGTVQEPGWKNWTSGNLTGCRDCHTYYGGEAPFNATNMGTEGTSPAGTAHGFAPNCTLCHGGADPVGFHSLAATEFIPRVAIALKPENIPRGKESMVEATVVLPPLMKVTRAEYFVDEMERDGDGQMLEYVIGGENTTSARLGAMIETASMSFGKHLVFVHVKDSAGKWSKPEIAVLAVTKPDGFASAETMFREIVPVIIFSVFLYFVWRRFM